MPPKRRGGVRSSQGTRSGTRSQHTVAQGSPEEVYDLVTVPDSPAANSGTNSRGSSVVITGERVAPGRLRPKEERSRGGVKPKRGRGRDKQAVLEEGVSDVYRDMLRDVVGASAKRPEELSDSDESRPLKKRKAVIARSNEVGPSSSGGDKGKCVLIEYSEDDTGNAIEYGDNENNVDSGEESEESSDESEVDWEEVDLSKQPTIDFVAEPPKQQSLELIFDQKKEQKASHVKRTITAVDRRIRLEVHKMHLLCLLIHVYQRSRWCNNPNVKENLRPFILKDVHLLLNPDPEDQQFRRSHNFLEGLKRASEMWQKKFRIAYKGASKPHWHDMETLKIILAQPPKDGEPPIKKEDFLAASVNFVGSRDLGAQLFCALLRSAGVICRLVCSVQPLSFTFQDKTAATKSAPTIPIAALQTEEDMSDGGNGVQVNKRFGGPGPTTPTTPARTRGGGLRRPRLREPIIKAPTPKKTPLVTIKESAYPVYWVEAWSMAAQKWIAVDPLVTATVGKPSKLEPPMSDAENVISYVIAFEEEGQAQDVTRRYAKSYNGKTRKLRVSNTKGGLEWWDRVLKVFQRGWDLDRDQLELAELMQREVSEPIPNNIQDLKDHPLFALKRHLKRGEIIYPEKKVGSVITGTGNKKVTETIFRRQDVKVVKSSEQWYRLGREVKLGEQPLKYVNARPRMKRRNDDEDSEVEGGGQEEGGKQTTLYAEFQTTLYEPPLVLYGKVPKNSFGNLDIFVPSMVPKGGVHLPYKGIAKAARLLGVDYAEAVTGFEFKGRQVSATINGIIIAKEYREAVETVMEGFLDEQNEAEDFKKSIETLKRWRRFLMALRIRERLGILPRDAKAEAREKREVKDKGGVEDGEAKSRVEDENDTDTGGGFFAEGGEDGNDGDGGGGGFIPEDSRGGGSIPEESQSEKYGSDMEILEDPEDEDLGWF